MFKKKTNVTKDVTDEADRVTDNQKKIITFIEDNNMISTSKIADNIGISKRKVLENINKLKKIGLIRRIGPAKGGHWEVLK